MIRVAGDLEEQFTEILTKTFGVILPERYWICQSTLLEVAEATRASYEDGRHHYPFSISLLKQIAINAFWIVKLKPLNNVMMLDRDTKDEIDFPDINEQVALYWAMTRVAHAVKSGHLNEVVSFSEENMALFRSVVVFYYTHGFFRNTTDFKPIPESVKVDEMTHNLRYKKFTAVNIYEVFCHLILPFRAVKAIPISEVVE